MPDDEDAFQDDFRASVREWLDDAIAESDVVVLSIALAEYGIVVSFTLPSAQLRAQLEAVLGEARDPLIAGRAVLCVNEKCIEVNDAPTTLYRWSTALVLFCACIYFIFY
jgi:hypothetical protein